MRTYETPPPFGLEHNEQAAERAQRVEVPSAPGVRLSSEAVPAVAFLLARRAALEQERAKISKDNGGVSYSVRATQEDTGRAVTDVTDVELLLIFDDRLSRNAEALRAYGLETAP